MPLQHLWRGDGQNEGFGVASLVRLLGADLEEMRLFNLLVAFPFSHKPERHVVASQRRLLTDCYYSRQMCSQNLINVRLFFVCARSPHAAGTTQWLDRIYLSGAARQNFCSVSVTARCKAASRQ